MGMLGLKTTLEELTCRVLSDLVEQGYVTSTAGPIPSTSYHMFSALRNWGLWFPEPKTVVSSRQTNIPGWILCIGSIKVSLHCIATLVSCDTPKKRYGPCIIYRHIQTSRWSGLVGVVTGAAQLLASLDDVVAGRNSKEKIAWSDHLGHDFRL